MPALLKALCLGTKSQRNLSVCVCLLRLTRYCPILLAFIDQWLAVQNVLPGRFKKDFTRKAAGNSMRADLMKVSIHFLWFRALAYVGWGRNCCHEHAPKQWGCCATWDEAKLYIKMYGIGRNVLWRGQLYGSLPAARCRNGSIFRRSRTNIGDVSHVH